MKYRSDFVTNSSSSSFVIAFHNKEEGMETIANLSKRFGSDYINLLLDDFIHATPIEKSTILEKYHEEFCGEAEYDVDTERWGWSRVGRKPTLREKWMQDHPGAKSVDWYESEERKIEIDKQVSHYSQSLIEAIGDRDYIVELEYEDHTSEGSALEHDILPDQDFTAWRFNHH